MKNFTNEMVVIKECMPFAVNYAKRNLGIRSKEEAEDAVQTACLNFLKVETERKKDRAYFITCIHNAAKQIHRRREHPRKDGMGKMNQFEDGYIDMIEVISSNEGMSEDFEQVQRLLGILSSEQRQIIDLFYFKGKTYKEIAGIMNWSFEKVKKIMYKSIQELRQFSQN